MRVLAIDDNPDILFLLGQVLGWAGHEVTLATGGREGIAMVREGARPDVVMLDIQMPAVAGWEVLTAIRSDEALADLCVVLCTVKGRPEDIVRGWELGCDGYITKPFDVDRLAGEIDAIYGRGPDERRRARASGLAEARAILQEREEGSDAVRSAHR